MTAPLVSVLMVGFNSQAFLGVALDAIPAAAARYRVEVLFIDNGEDGSDDRVRQHHPWVKVSQSLGNVGFGRANNHLALAARGDWLLLLNPDTQIAPGAIDVLADAAIANPRFGILGGISVDGDGTPLAMSQLTFPSLGQIARGLIGRARAAPLPPTDMPCAVVPVDAVSGGFMLIERKLWDRLGGFDPRFFLYAEELDLCRRAAALGAATGIVPEARMVHHVGSGNPHAPARLLYAMRGIATYYIKHFSPPYAFACLGLHWLSCVVRWAGTLVLGIGAPRFRQMERGLRAVALAPWRWMGGY